MKEIKSDEDQKAFSVACQKGLKSIVVQMIEKGVCIAISTLVK